jgi:dTDP-4-dehydrorhamnose reductase
VPRQELDITDPAATLSVIGSAGPELILHAAALTRVNYCESHPQEALRVNAEGTAHVAAAARACGAALVYFSSDYVFGHAPEQERFEDSATGPLNAYGLSKLRGEEAAALVERHHIVRTSGVFGPVPGGQEHNFFKAIYAQLSGSPNPLRVVDDIWTRVSYAPHLAAIVAQLLEVAAPPALVHVTSSGEDSWAGWARCLAEAAGFPPERIVGISAAERPADAPRPARSVLSTRYPEISKLISEHPARQGIQEYAVEFLQKTGQG